MNESTKEMRREERRNLIKAVFVNAISSMGFPLNDEEALDLIKGCKKSVDMLLRSLDAESYKQEN